MERQRSETDSSLSAARTPHAGLRLLERMGRHEWSILLTALVMVAAAWSFFAIAGEVAEGDWRAFDERALQALRAPADPSRPRGPLWLQTTARDITALGGVSVLTLVVAGVCGYLLLQRRPHALALVLGSTLGAVLVTNLIKAAFARPRPTVVPRLVEVSTASFPSGHAMLSAAVYVTLGALLARLDPRLRVKAYLLLCALLITGLVGVSRVYLGVHYPSDVLAGWTLGLSWACGCWLVARGLQRRGKVEAPG